MRYIATDIDGVLTDGRFLMDALGNENKQICYRDLDAIGIGRRSGFEFIFVTAEKGQMPERIAKRFAVDRIISGAKDKLVVIDDICKSLNISHEELTYIGDSNRDAPALEAVGFSFAPSDATPKAKNAAKHIVPLIGGMGVLLWVVEYLLENS